MDQLLTQKNATEHYAIKFILNKKQYQEYNKEVIDILDGYIHNLEDDDGLNLRINFDVEYRGLYHKFIALERLLDSKIVRTADIIEINNQRMLFVDLIRKIDKIKESI